MNIKSVWKRILANEGKTFYTVTGLPFTYEVIDEYKIRPFREGKSRWDLSKNLFEKALSFKSFDTSDFYHKIIGASYVRSILEDDRII